VLGCHFGGLNVEKKFKLGIEGGACLKAKRGMTERPAAISWPASDALNDVRFKFRSSRFHDAIMCNLQ
jgi:hypothetical protein